MFPSVRKDCPMLDELEWKNAELAEFGFSKFPDISVASKRQAFHKWTINVIDKWHKEEERLRNVYIYLPLSLSKLENTYNKILSNDFEGTEQEYALYRSVFVMIGCLEGWWLTSTK